MASSNRYQTVERAACWPWKASEFSRRHVWAVTNQDSGAALAQIFCVPGWMCLGMALRSTELHENDRQRRPVAKGRCNTGNHSEDVFGSGT